MSDLRVALYARVSTQDRGQDVGLQLEDLRRVAHQRGWRIMGEFVDDGISGSIDSRPALGRLEQSVSKGEVDIVAVWKLDRLGRSLAHLIRLLDRFQQSNVQFVSLGEAGIDTTTAQGRLLLNIFGAFAEYERALTRERVVAGVRRAQAHGIHCGRPKVEIAMPVALALKKEGHSQAQIARLMGVSRSTLRRRLISQSQSSQSNPAG